MQMTLCRAIGGMASILVTFFVHGCAAPSNLFDTPSLSQPQWAKEADLAVDPIAYSEPVTTLFLRFQFVRPQDDSLNNQTLPIPNAEVWIRQGSFILQRGLTDELGLLTTVIPRPVENTTISIQINSRSFHTHYSASVLEGPDTALFYSHSFTQTITSSASQVGTAESPLNLIVPLNTPSLVSGAFNLLYNTLLAYKFLKQNVSTDIMLPKVTFFWKKGFSPSSYFDRPGAVTFYVAKNSDYLPSGIYILGGLNGQICNVDTDHFDNSVILHEYAHFLEDHFSMSDSPGGSHTGNGIIDPRLAWSEGWANYFQGMVLNRGHYRDTYSVGCPNARLDSLLYSLVRNTGTNVDIPNEMGEGAFREMAIARYLYGLTGTYSGGTYSSMNLPFSLIWDSFIHLKQPYLVLRSSHHFNRHIKQSGLLPSHFFQQTMTVPFYAERQSASLQNWATPLTPFSGNQCEDNPEFGIFQGYFRFLQGQPKPDRTPEGSVLGCNNFGEVGWSDMFASNDFYVIHITGNQANTITLEYHPEGSGIPYDLDMYLYSPDFVHLDPRSIVRASDRFYPEQGTGAGREIISLLGLAPGTYILNIKVDNGACPRATTRYQLRWNNNQILCPKQDPMEN